MDPTYLSMTSVILTFISYRERERKYTVPEKKGKWVTIDTITHVF